MSVPVIAFFNNQGGVGKTFLVYHMAWMVADLGLRLLAVDLDPQCHLTAAFLDEQRLEELLATDRGETSGPNKPSRAEAATIYDAILPLRQGIGDVMRPHLEILGDRLALIPGDLALSEFEDDLSQVWPTCLDRDERALRVISAFWRVLQQGAEQQAAEVILMDLGSNLGAINRAALIAADHVVIPLSPDLFSLQGLRNLGPTLGRWRTDWRDRLHKAADQHCHLALPAGSMNPLGYIIMPHSVRQDRPVKADGKWLRRIPQTYDAFVARQPVEESVRVDGDSACLWTIKHFRSLMPMAQAVRKPIFYLKPADGALGSHMAVVREAQAAFKQLAITMLSRAGVALPS